MPRRPAPRPGTRTARDPRSPAERAQEAATRALSGGTRRNPSGGTGHGPADDPDFANLASDLEHEFRLSS